MSFMIKMAGETFRNAILEDHSTCIYTICTLIVNRTHLISILVWQYYKLYNVVLKKNTNSKYIPKCRASYSSWPGCHYYR